MIKIGTDVNSVDNFGNTSLYLTAHSGYIKDNGVWVNIEETANSVIKIQWSCCLKKGKYQCNEPSDADSFTYCSRRRT
ncbi:hypothetical protein [Wolbachia endosymbiont of Nilaparvata lugens]|uniref:hypothetical protein n=1 Tax=Wolbachia endosymbiont of Nilaparvata lugens TaxID=357143 RepID=UPI00397DEF86